VLSFDELIEYSPRADEGGERWDSSECSRLGRLARRLWAGLLAVEEVARP